MCLSIPGKIISISDTDSYARTAEVSFSGLLTTVNLAFVPEAEVNDYVIVHAGFAISLLDEEEALATLASFEQLKKLQEESQ